MGGASSRAADAEIFDKEVEFKYTDGQPIVSMSSASPCKIRFYNGSPYTVELYW